MIEDQLLDQNEQAQEEYQENAPVEEASEAAEAPEEQSLQRKIENVTQPSQAEMNIRRLREGKEQAERERDELLRRLDSIEKKINPQVEPLQDDPISYAADDLIEGRHLSQYERKLKALENQLKTYQQQTAETVVETKIKQQYQDFDQVVTKDNLELLRLTYPELASSLHSTPDLYNKAVTAYTLIKKLGIQPDVSQYNPDQARVQLNSSRPRPVASVAPQTGDSPLSRANAFANGLTEELKAQLYKEMIEAKSRG